MSSSSNQIKAPSFSLPQCCLLTYLPDRPLCACTFHHRTPCHRGRNIEILHQRSIKILSCLQTLRLVCLSYYILHRSFNCQLYHFIWLKRLFICFKGFFMQLEARFYLWINYFICFHENFLCGPQIFCINYKDSSLSKLKLEDH